uniref:Pre-mRNA-splicing factor 38 n=1 Tax=Meloidogyne incognita TaxID=6306 RepID=A0A914N524_MELIC
MDFNDATTFKDVMGFNIASNDVFYEDDAADTSIPDIQKITRKNNILPIWGNVQTMNLNTLVLENIVQSTYWKNFLLEVSTYQQVCDEVFIHVRHLEPWERGTRKITGMTGMCGGVRGVGAGGVISTAFCLLYKLFTVRVTRKQLVAMMNSRQSVYLRGLAFMFIRYTQPPGDLWAWMEPYLDDETEIDPRSGGGDKMQFGQLIRMMLTKLDFYGTLFPRIPIPIQKEMETKFRERAKLYGYEDDRYSDRRRSRSRERSPRGRDVDSGADSEKRSRHRSRDRSRERQHVSRERSRDRHRSSRDRSRDRHRTSRERRESKQRRRSRSRERNKSREHENTSIDTSTTTPIAIKSSEIEIPSSKRRHRQKCHHHLRHHHCIKHRRICPSKAKKQHQQQKNLDDEKEEEEEGQKINKNEDAEEKEELIDEKIDEDNVSNDFIKNEEEETEEIS